MTTTSAPIGSTAQSLDGFAVDANVVAAFRESVVITGPNVSTETIVPTSTQPVDVYALPTWLLGTPSVSVAAMPAAAAPTGTTQVFGSVSSFAVNNPATVSTQVISSIPLIVAQSSAPWDVRGNVGVTSHPAVASTWPLNTTMANIVSSIPLTVNPHALTGTSQVFGTVSTQIVSSVPIYASQSSAPWVISPIATTAGGGNATSIVCVAGLNTTVIKASRGQLYSIAVSYLGSSNAWLKICNASTAAPVSTAPTKFLIGLAQSTHTYHAFPLGTEFDTGIVMYTIRTPFAAGSGTTGILTSSMTVSICYE